MKITIILLLMGILFGSQTTIAKVSTSKVNSGRTIIVDLVALQHDVHYNRLGAHLPSGQLYALSHDVVPMDHPMTVDGQDLAVTQPQQLQPGKVRLKSYKRPRPIVLRANVGDTLEIHLHNLLPAFTTTPAIDCNGPAPTDSTALNEFRLNCAGLQVMGLDWLNDNNNQRIAPGQEHIYRYLATNDGVFMLYSPNGSSIPSSQLDHGLFGAVNVQSETAEWYRSQVTREDLKAAIYKTSKAFLNDYWQRQDGEICQLTLNSSQTGLPQGTKLQRQAIPEGSELICPESSEQTVWSFSVPTSVLGQTQKVSEVIINAEGYLHTQAGHPVIDYQAHYPDHHERAGMPVLNMLKVTNTPDRFQLMHSDVTAIITGPEAGRFPYYLDGPNFRNNPATPDRRQPYREFTIAYHIAPLTQQAFPAFDSGPLAGTLAAGKDDFSINYGIAGIAPEIYANRIHVGPMGINKDEVDLRFEEFFLSAWAVGDPAMVADIPANNPNGLRATKALYPDDPSNVYHSYMRDHVIFRVMNAGSVAPHVHHQHAHQWLHSRNSDDGHYLDSQLINPGSTYTLEMTYNGSGNRNQTVGDSIFHCHIYPHFAQGMWSMWRVHDVFEAGTELDKSGKPIAGARALPDGEIVAGTPIPSLVPLPTLGMAPIPAKIELVDNGRRVKVIAKGEDEHGLPVFDNPGFPFFVPGIAGHRAPHPPMDFGWRENAKGEQMFHTKASIGAFDTIGQPVYLNGGLPRHVITGGKVAREFHSRWDFTKDFALYDDQGKFLSGDLLALQIPEQGTLVEQAAMAAHAQRTHASYQPDGRPGNFILNGLPPAPGAPYAAPDVDDYGNSNFNARRYKAAVIQMDVVFNKEGWHYPQQRFITLLDDVKDTIGGIKPPEPFFFRSNTGETVEFWHTNLVPEYYELDDFQVRTPTDILGQHIHLVKFDVTSSDGAANGFNYEDGTLSPDEVRDRINAINAQGGLYHYDLAEQGASEEQSLLTISSYKQDYGNILGTPPAGQDWNGAQTTIQRFDTDPLLNNEGEDRTLRTVFTHDHFGPSTHQQAGLYGAMLVEPEGSTWKDPINGCVMPADGKCEPKRSDGGPTSWQAIIETADKDDSYREFAIAVSDLQLAYQPESKFEASAPAGVWFNTENKDYVSELDQGNVPSGLSTVFTSQGAIIPSDATVTTLQAGTHWTLKRNAVDSFDLTLNDKLIEVRNLSMDHGWADTELAIWPPPANPTAGAGPYPQIISDPGGGGNIGAWLANYRNEPLDARLQAGGGALAHAEDPAFAYSSIARQNSRLNSQPGSGAPIDPDRSYGFKYPIKDLVPEVQAKDPYTPMLRAYAGDKVQIRTVVGAVDSVHSFQVQGVKWQADPSFKNSGFRNSQGFGISEHFEMLFDIPPADKHQKAAAADYLYAPSTSAVGQAKGAWGILRAYKDEQVQLQALPNNPLDTTLRISGLYKAKGKVRHFNVGIKMNNNGDGLSYVVNGKRVSPLILRAAAGEWIKIKLHNHLKPKDVENLQVQFANNVSGSASSKNIKPYTTSATAGLHAMLLDFNTLVANGINIGMNGVEDNRYQTIAPGHHKTIHWYTGDIKVVDGERVLQPVELGAVNLLPADSLLQASYGLTGVLIVEPEASKWSKKDQHKLSLVIKDRHHNPLFTEVVVVGNQKLDKPVQVTAGTEIRMRVVNPGTGSAGTINDSVNVLTIEGHGWAELPYQDDSSVIGDNVLSQWLGTQQITALESYNMVLPSAGGVDAVPGEYAFYYYPKGPAVALGTLDVVPAN